MDRVRASKAEVAPPPTSGPAAQPASPKSKDSTPAPEQPESIPTPDSETPTPQEITLKLDTPVSDFATMVKMSEADMLKRLNDLGHGSLTAASPVPTDAAVAIGKDLGYIVKTAQVTSTQPKHIEDIPMKKDSKKIDKHSEYDKTGGIWEITPEADGIRRKKMIANAVSGAPAVPFSKGDEVVFNTLDSMGEGTIETIKESTYVIKSGSRTIELSHDQVFEKPEQGLF